MTRFRAVALAYLCAAGLFAYSGLFEWVEPGWRFVGGVACLAMIAEAWRMWWAA